MLSEVEICQFISTKLCHDLAGALGAINSGLDFLDSENLQMREKARELVKNSSTQTINRLVFFRNAYGVSKNSGEANLDEIKKIASDYLSNTKVSLDFHEKYFHMKDTFVSVNLGKLILCMIQQAYANLIHGGSIKVEILNNPMKKIIITSIGESLKIDEQKIEILTGLSEISELTTQNCTTLFAYKFSKTLGANINITTSSNLITYEITF